MRYFYYPGCSLEGTATEYNASTQAVMAALGVELLELEDWTCCGASAVDSISYLLSLVLPARNLALAQKTELQADFLIPCSACYLNLRRVDDHIKRDEGLLNQINEVLKVEDLNYRGGMKARHLMDILAHDIGPEEVKARVKYPLTGLRIVPYYGCQALRPYGSYDDPERPKSMEPILEALGAEVHPWSMGAKCCGAGLMTTKKEVGLELTAGLLTAARGADCVVTICPMCQMNLDAYQGKVSQLRGEDLSITVLYLPQLMGMAFGLLEEDLKLKLNFAFTDAFQQKLRNTRQETASVRS
jgi:heterodisulfide reductase subunit B2